MSYHNNIEMEKQQKMFENFTNKCGIQKLLNYDYELGDFTFSIFAKNEEEFNFIADINFHKY